MKAIALIDYRAGNLTSVRKGFAAVGAELFTPVRARELDDCAAIVVPGVGHFNSTEVLDDEWRTVIRNAVANGVPLLGICLGLQWLFDGSEEAPALPGLAALNGRCFRLPPPGDVRTSERPDIRTSEPPDVRTSGSYKVPHVGWNSLELTRPSALFDGVATGTQMYFTHSYAAPITDDTVAATTHGTPFAAAVERGRVCGVQFHPEKSGAAGLRVLSNFLGTLKRNSHTGHSALSVPDLPC
jgi:imidazole glycerol-phosphate synthase subunit HisH